MSDKRKKSWKEIDAQKDRSQHRRDEPKPGGRGPRERDPSKSHRATLDQLFGGSGIAELVRRRDAQTGVTAEERGPSRKALSEAIHAASEPRARQKAMDDYLAAFSMPRDFDVLAQLLSHEDPDVVEKALNQLGGLLDQEKPKRPRVLTAQLKTLAELSEWGKLRRLASALLERL